MPSTHADACTLRHAAPIAGGSAPPLPPQPRPARPRALRLPGVEERWRYAVASWRGRLAWPFSGHRLRAERAPRYSACVAVSEQLLARWHRLFDVPAAAAQAMPLLYHQGVGALLGRQVFADLGIQPRHLLHLKHQTHHLSSKDGSGTHPDPRGGRSAQGTGLGALSSAPARAAARGQQLVCGLKRALRMAQDQALIELELQLLAADGTALAVMLDSYLVCALPATDLQALPSDANVMRELLGLHRRDPQLDSGAQAACVRRVPLAPGLALSYGRISGELLPVHAAGLDGRLLGVQRPVLQQLGLRDMAVRHLADIGVPLGRLSIAFARPAHLGQTLSLVLQGSRFELQDDRRRLVAYGQAGEGSAGSEPLGGL